MSIEPANPGAHASAPSDLSAYPRKLCEAELRLLRARRAAAGVNAGEATDAPLHTVGLAFSGGGIRSATFCLGFCQALARQGLLRRVDYLSTVSGGGYVGAFLGALLCRPDSGGIAGAERTLSDPASRIVHWLRENGRYLSPNGAGDEILAVAVLLRNAIAVQVVLATAAVASLGFAIAVRVIGEVWLVGWHHDYHPAAVSPYFLLPALALGVGATPLAWAYWMAPGVDASRPGHRDRRALISSAVVALLLAAVALVIAHEPAAWGDRRAPLLTLCGGMAGLIAIAWASLYLAWRGARAADDADERQAFVTEQRMIRNRLSACLARVLWFALGAAALAAVDSLGVRVHPFLLEPSWTTFGEIAAPAGLSAVAVWLLRVLRKLAPRSDGGLRLSLPLEVLAGVAAAIVVAGAAIAVAGVVHAVAWGALLMPSPSAFNVCASAALLCLAAGTLSVAFGRTIRFLNDSSDHALYGARLARAYLGASNPARLRGGTGAERRVTDPIANDDFAMCDYAPERSGGPLHIINATLNETVSGESLIEYRDRKGLAFAVGPVGLSAGTRHHALWPQGDGAARRETAVIAPIPHPAGCEPYHALADGAGDARHPVEPLSLATWVAISGAAVAPGLGSRTSLGLSVLLTLFNVRLGYWWDSGVRPETRPDRVLPGLAQRFSERLAQIFPVQTHLVYELLSRFYGPNRQRWYLSDGGHFENTACYELIRRRVTFIVACDCGEDAEYAFADIANLVRKARTDFGAEIRFLSDRELDEIVAPSIRAHLGTPALFTRRRWNPADAQSASCPYGLVATVTYADGGPPSTILFVKPAIRGDEPEDVLNYRRTHSRFPNESTADQYFDEAQWEAYRRLGEVAGTRLLDSSPNETRWSPTAALAGVA